MNSVDRPQQRRLGRWFGALLLATTAVLVPAVTTSALPATALDNSVQIGSRVGYGGTGLFQIWSKTPTTGEPDFWAYCIEHDVSAKTGVEGYVGNLDSFLGSNYFADPALQAKVLWLLAHSYPSLSLVDFGAAAGVPGISQNDAVEATQYAIWRYTDLTWDASWNFETPDSEAAYWYLVNGANASTGLTPAEVTASIAAPTTHQTAGTLVGPFVVSTNQSAVSVAASPSLDLTDVKGNPINAASVVGGQELYLDLRDSTTAGEATITVTAKGSSVTGRVVSVPTTVGVTPTAGDHAQSIILVAPSSATTSGSASTQWSAQPLAGGPSIMTSLVDAADGDRALPWNGGTAIDSVAYQNLTPGTSYILSGALIRKSDGSITGITGSTTFVATEPGGSIDVTFVIPEGYAGQTLVAYERLFAGTAEGVDPVAVHEDIDDAAQTVTIEERKVAPVKPSTTTPSELAATGSAPLDGLATLAFLGIIAGAALTLVRRRV